MASNKKFTGIRVTRGRLWSRFYIRVSWWELWWTAWAGLLESIDASEYWRHEDLMNKLIIINRHKWELEIRQNATGQNATIFVDNRFDGINSMGKTYPTLETKLIIWRDKNSSKHTFNRETRKPCYRKDDGAMRPIYGCPEKFRESSQTPPATFPEICKGFLFRSILRMCTQNLKLMSKNEDKDLIIGPRGSSRTRTFLEDNNTLNIGSQINTRVF